MTRTTLTWTFFLSLFALTAGGLAHAQIDPDAVGEDLEEEVAETETDADTDADAEAPDTESEPTPEPALTATPAPPAPAPAPAPQPADANLAKAAVDATVIVPIARRPQILPAGQGGLDVFINMPTMSFDAAGDDTDLADFTDLMFLSAEGKISLGGLEALAGADLLLKQPDDFITINGEEIDPLTRIYAGARVKAGELATVTGRFAFHHPTDEIQVLEADGSFLFKRPLAPTVAVLAGAGFNWRNILFSDIETEQPFWMLRATGNIGIQAQPSAQLMLHGGLELAVPVAANPNEDEPDSMTGEALTPDTAVNLTAGGIYSVSPSFDLYGTVELIDGFSRRLAMVDFVSAGEGIPTISQTNILFGGRARF